MARALCSRASQQGGLKTRTGLYEVQQAEADRHEQEHEQEQDKHAQHKHEQELSPSGRQRRPSSPAPSPSSPTPSCWGRRSEGETSARRRGAPGDARSETATGRDAIHERTLQTRSPKSFFSLGQLPSRRPPEAADPLRLPPVAGCRRCEAPERPAAGCTGGHFQRTTPGRPTHESQSKIHSLANLAAVKGGH